MALVNLVLIVCGVGLMAFGYQRARAPWARYQALRDEDRNIERYASWRGGVRDTSTSGASVAMSILRRQARIGAAIVGLGFVLTLAGFLLGS